MFESQQRQVMHSGRVLKRILVFKNVPKYNNSGNVGTSSASFFYRAGFTRSRERNDFSSYNDDYDNVDHVTFIRLQAGINIIINIIIIIMIIIGFIIVIPS